MKLGRIFANAIVRRLAYVLVAMVLAWLGIGRAHAAVYSDQGAARSACMAAQTVAMGHASAKNPMPNSCTEINAAGTINGVPHLYFDCRIATGDGNTYAYSCNFLGAGGDGTFAFPQSASCSGRPTSTFSSDLSIPTGSSGCSNGCEFDVHNNGDGTYTRFFSTAGNSMCSVLPECTTPGWYLNHATSLCQPPEEECPANQTKNPKTKQCEEACPTGMVMDATGACKPSQDDCPVGQVRSPEGNCLPGDGQCAAGEARRPNGTCGVDADGDGVADDDDEDPDNDTGKPTFSGGDTCNAPPSCSGNAIDCGQARIQWRIDCNTRRKVNITGGACAAMPVCVGENCQAMEYAQLMQQWKAACALEKLANAEPGEPGEGGDNQDLIDLLTSEGTINGTHGDTGGMPGGDGFEFGETEIPEPDTSGMGYGSSCPSPPSFSVYGQTISINLAPMCNWVGLAGNLVLILAALASMRIVSGSTA